MKRKQYELLKGIFEVEKDWNEYSQEEQQDVVAKKAKILLQLIDTDSRLETALVGNLKQEYIALLEKKTKEYILGRFPTLAKINNKTQKEK